MLTSHDPTSTEDNTMMTSRKNTVADQQSHHPAPPEVVIQGPTGEILVMEVFNIIKGNIFGGLGGMRGPDWGSCRQTWCLVHECRLRTRNLRSLSCLPTCPHIRPNTHVMGYDGSGVTQ